MSIIEILTKNSVPAQVKKQHCVLAVHDSCTARFNRKLQDEVRQLAIQAGYEIEELPYSREKTH